MPYQEEFNMEQLGNRPMEYDYDTEMMQPYTETMAMQAMGSSMTYRSLYPEIYYKIIPYIFMAIDLIFAHGIMPTIEKLEEITEDIFNDFCRMNPDLADYLGGAQAIPAAAIDPPFFGGGFRGGVGFGSGFGGFRRMGLGRDLIFALLLSELFNRGGFIY